ncbi:hypothetical protein CBR_g3644 [Chara braunii]|uniref:Uncharacterized protein n=1 Tax=Chara braunii TaxID=69332 RepID=A0A388KFW8_CHABU|nr:hypothetical protein CBR_g3644 [Chara braunii]|eukprot:GBG68945.1 hypothetical protein CBR_g3644 [Chara braunii]
MSQGVGASSGPKKGLTLDDLRAAIDRHERNPSNIPKVDTFHFCGERVSEWLERVEQALVGRSDVVKFQRILQYVLHSYHQEVKKVIDATQVHREAWLEVGTRGRPIKAAEGGVEEGDEAGMAAEEEGNGMSKAEETKARGIKARGIKARGTKARGIKARGIKEVTKATGTKARGIKAREIKEVRGMGDPVLTGGRPSASIVTSKAGLISSTMDGNIYDQFGEAIDRRLGGVRAEAQRRATSEPPPPATFRLWQEKEGPPIGVEEVGSDEEVTQGPRGGSRREEPIIIESDDEDEERRMKPSSVLLGKMEDLLDKVGRYQQKLVDLCDEVRKWRSSIPKVFHYDSGPESAPRRPGVNMVGSSPQSGMMGRPLTPQARLTQAARTRSQAKTSANQEPPRREPESGKRKEAVKVEDDDNEEEEDERLRREEDQRAERRARKKGAKEEVEPVVRDGPPKRKKYAARLEEGFDVERVIDRLLEGHNDLMTLKEILASAPRLHDELKGRLSWRLVPNVHLGTILSNEAEWVESGTEMDWKCVACGTVNLVVKGSKCAAMVDTRAEMNIIREADAIRFGLDIDRSECDGLSRINWDKQEGEAVENTPPVDGFLDQEKDVRLHINKWSPRVPSCVGYPIWQAPNGYERRAELVLKPFEEEDLWGGKDVQWMMELALTSSHRLVEDMRMIEGGPGQVERHEVLMGGMYLLVNTLLQESFGQSCSLNPTGNMDEVPESQDDEFEEGEIKEAFRAEEYDGIYLELGLLLSCEMRLRDASLTLRRQPFQEEGGRHGRLGGRWGHQEDMSGMDLACGTHRVDPLGGDDEVRGGDEDAGAATLASHALEHPDLEESAPAEPRQEPCQPEKKMEAEIPKRVDLRTKERAPAGETGEEKRARRTKRIEEIWQERQRLEAVWALPEQQQERQSVEGAGALSGQPPSAPAKASKIPEMWRDFWEQRGEEFPLPTRAGFGVARKAKERLDRKIKFLAKATFDRHLLLESDLAGKKIKEAGHGVRLEAMEVEIQELRALVVIQATIIESLRQRSQGEVDKPESSRRGEQRQPGHGLPGQPSAAETRQEPPMGRVILEREEARA